MKLYNNDLEKAKMNAQFLEAKAIQKHVEITSSTLSRFKNNENPEWKTIDAIANLPVPQALQGLMVRFKDKELTYPQIQDLVVRLNVKHPEWLDYLAVQIETAEDLQLVRYLITLCNLSGKTVNNLMSFNPLSIKTHKVLAPEVKVDSFIESVYDILFPEDKARKKFHQEVSLILDNTLDGEEQLCLRYPQYREHEAGTSLESMFQQSSLEKQKHMLAFLLVYNYRSVRQEVKEKIESFLRQNDQWAKSDIPEEIFDHEYDTEEDYVCIQKQCLHPALIKLMVQIGFEEVSEGLALSLFRRAQGELL